MSPSPSLKNLCPLPRQIAPRLFLSRILPPNLPSWPIEEQSIGQGDSIGRNDNKKEEERL